MGEGGDRKEEKEDCTELSLYTYLNMSRIKKVGQGWGEGGG